MRTASWPGEVQGRRRLRPGGFPSPRREPISYIIYYIRLYHNVRYNLHNILIRNILIYDILCNILYNLHNLFYSSTPLSPPQANPDRPPTPPRRAAPGRSRAAADARSRTCLLLFVIVICLYIVVCIIY